MELPELPEPWADAWAFTADQMRSYARQAVAAAMERAAQICEERAGTVSMFATSREASNHNQVVRGCAAAIRSEMSNDVQKEERK